MPITSYRDLEVWQRSTALVEACYVSTRRFQPRNVSFSAYRSGSRPFHFLPTWPRVIDVLLAPIEIMSSALGSHAELETYLELTRRLELLKDPPLAQTEVLLESVGQLLHGLVRALERS